MKDKNTFTIKFSEGYFSKNDIINIGNTTQAKVVKVYKYTWWRKLLAWFGMPFKMMDMVKVEEVNNDNTTKGFKEKPKFPKPRGFSKGGFYPNKFTEILIGYVLPITIIMIILASVIYKMIM